MQIVQHEQLLCTEEMMKVRCPPDGSPPPQFTHYFVWENDTWYLASLALHLSRERLEKVFADKLECIDNLFNKIWLNGASLVLKGTHDLPPLITEVDEEEGDPPSIDSHVDAQYYNKAVWSLLATDDAEYLYYPIKTRSMFASKPLGHLRKMAKAGKIGPSRKSGERLKLPEVLKYELRQQLPFHAWCPTVYSSLTFELLRQELHRIAATSIKGHLKIDETFAACTLGSINPSIQRALASDPSVATWGLYTHDGVTDDASAKSDETDFIEKCPSSLSGGGQEASPRRNSEKRASEVDSENGGSEMVMDAETSDDETENNDSSLSN
ncbi:hypothetical protein DIPPA_10737 [Diplonema papillatum]|nr:hypothetical protein DIPPA_10737 [Diplonema papillatum]